MTSFHTEQPTDMRRNTPTLTAFLIPALGLLATTSCLGQAAFPTGLEIRGKVVDIETGRPIGAFVIQEGWAHPDAPGRMIWGWRMTGRSYR